MALRYDFDSEKFVQAAAYLVERCPSMTKMKLFKLLFLADKKHMAEWGRPIFGGRYVAMKDGPLHSEGYDILKNVRHAMHSFVQVRGRDIRLLTPMGTDALSRSDTQALDATILEFKNESDETLGLLSHEEKWWKAASRNACIPFEHFLEGADEEFIRQVEEDQKLRDLVADISLFEESRSA